MKDVFTKYKIIAFSICAILINFISIYTYFYFGSHYMVPKYIPAIMAGIIGYILLKKNWIANLAFGTALIILCFPLLSQQFVITNVLIILQFIEILIIYNGGFMTTSLIIGLERGQINFRKSLPILINIALAIFLITSGILSFLTNTCTADMYVNKNYSTSGFTRVSSEFSQFGVHGHYFFVYQKKNGEKLFIETEGICVFYDSIKGNG